MRGAANLTAPNPATNAEFTRALGAAVHRPTVLPTPLLPLKAVYGSELVDAPARRTVNACIPRVLEQSGYEFAHAQTRRRVARGVGGTGCGVTFAAAGSAMG